MVKLGIISIGIIKAHTLEGQVHDVYSAVWILYCYPTCYRTHNIFQLPAAENREICACFDCFIGIGRNRDYYL
jgi:hypothetical protein